MKICIASRLYGMVSHDITNHCNARCKFCFNDWKKLHPCNMEKEIFKKSRSIIPFCNPELFLFSCLFEPTLHPEFFSLLYMIPYQYRDKVFFTTNLVKKLSDDELVALCNSPVSYFNISLETYDDSKYSFLSGTKNSVFYDNLSRLGNIAKSLGKNKKIRIITMILRSNMDEIISLIERVHREISPVVHELRTPYVSDAIETFLKDEMLSRQELNLLYEKIKALGYNEVVLDLGRDKEVFDSHIERKKNIVFSDGIKDDNPAHRVRIEPNGLETLDTVLRNQCINTFTYRVRINSDGTGYFNDTDEYFDLHDIEDVTMFWADKLRYLQEKETEQYLFKDATSYEAVLYSDEALRGELSEVIIYDGEFVTLHGYCEDRNGFWQGKERVVLLMQKSVDGVLLHTQTITQQDVGTAGFATKISFNRLDVSSEVEVFVGYKDNDCLHMRKLAVLPSLQQFVR